MYIINTDQGYIRGELHNGLQFVYEKEDARIYSDEEMELFGDIIKTDLYTYYSCESVEVEQLF